VNWREDRTDSNSYHYRDGWAWRVHGRSIKACKKARRDD